MKSYLQITLYSLFAILFAFIFFEIICPLLIVAFYHIYVFLDGILSSFYDWIGYTDIMKSLEPDFP